MRLLSLEVGVLWFNLFAALTAGLWTVVHLLCGRPPCGWRMAECADSTVLYWLSALSRSTVCECVCVLCGWVFAEVNTVSLGSHTCTRSEH